MSTKPIILRIDSRDRVNGTNRSDARFQLSRPITNVIGYRLASFTCFNTLSNITDRNNTIRFVYGNFFYNATIPPGIYSYDTFATALQTALSTAAMANVTVTKNTTNASYTITWPVTTSLIPAATTMNKILNLPTNATGTTWTTGIVNVNYLTTYFELHSNALATESTISTTARSSAVAWIPNPVPVYSLINYLPAHSLDQQMTFSGPRTISDIDFSLRLWNGETVDLNGVDYSITLKLYTQE
jgi:hypothetical protein